MIASYGKNTSGVKEHDVTGFRELGALAVVKLNMNA